MREQAGTATAAWDHALRVIGPALALSDPGYLDDARQALIDDGIVQAVAGRDTAVIYDWLLGVIQYQGMSDANVEAFSAAHGLVGWHDLDATTATRPSCPKLQSYWHFSGCGYRKGAFTCAEPGLIADCPLPMHALRNGRLSQAAYSLFMRDVCDGDIVGWIDGRLEKADRPEAGDRAAGMGEALLRPLRNVHGVSDKVLSMSLSMLLLAADPNRGRWVATGAAMIVIDTLVHNYLHRTGILRRFDADHIYGDRCYAAGGCADIVEELAKRIDARALNPAFPACFPRFIQHSIWRFCAASRWDICNGNRIDDRSPCANELCPAYPDCDRISPHTSGG